MQSWWIQFSAFSVQRLVSILLITTSLLGGCAAYNPKLFMSNKELETKLPPYEKLSILGDHSRYKNLKQIIAHELSQNIFNPKMTPDTLPHSFNIEVIVNKVGTPLTLLGCLSITPALLLLPTPLTREMETKILFYDGSGNLLALFKGSGRGTAASTYYDDEATQRRPPNELSRAEKTALSKALVISIEEIKNKIHSSQSELLDLLKTPPRK